MQRIDCKTLPIESRQYHVQKICIFVFISPEDNGMTVDLKYLGKIDTPNDLRRLKPDELPEVCRELRDFIINEVSSNPGHLGSSLGTVELTVALHYCYNTPEDKLVWDVGHQAYGHKILTGRRTAFHTNRKFGGISGFPRREESEYDAFVGGHASVSISASLGMDTASRLKGENCHVVAIIGDGSIGGGLAFEGLNNAGGDRENDILVILNDNRISIDPNVGALKEYLLEMTTSKGYNRFKTKAFDALSALPGMRNIIRKLTRAVKSSLLQQSNLFESMNFRYFGPVDGHDVIGLTKVLEDLKRIKGPKLLHVLTVKGKGFKPAEENQTAWHAPGCFNPDTGERSPSSDEPILKYQDVFGLTIVELAEKNDTIVGITPAMPTGCSLNIMQKAMPGRVFDVGIAEGHAVTFSAGLATQGIIPFCNIYSSFMQRAYDNVIHDVALQKLDVVFCLDRGGLVGEDGPTHHGAFDLAYFRCIPNMTVSAPMDERELRDLMYTAQLGGKGPFVIRYPRGCGVCVDWRKEFEEIEIGKGRLLKEGKDVAVLSLGHPGNFVREAIEKAEAEGISAAHIDMRFLKPLDTELLHYAGKNFRNLITVEDGVIAGGFGSAVVEFMNDNGYRCRVRRLGIGDEFITHGTVEELRRLCGFDADGIYDAIKEMTEAKSGGLA